MVVICSNVVIVAGMLLRLTLEIPETLTDAELAEVSQVGNGCPGDRPCRRLRSRAGVGGFVESLSMINCLI